MVWAGKQAGLGKGDRPLCSHTASGVAQQSAIDLTSTCTAATPS